MSFYSVLLLSYTDDALIFHYEINVQLKTFLMENFLLNWTKKNTNLIKTFTECKLFFGIGFD